MTPHPGGSAPNFRAAFCQAFRCSDDRYPAAVLRRCFPPLSRPLGTLLLSLRPHWFRRELSVINRLGEATSESQLKGELEGYAYENARDRSFRTETLGLRLSRRRFLQLYRTLRVPRSPAAPGPDLSPLP